MDGVRAPRSRRWALGLAAGMALGGGLLAASVGGVAAHGTGDPLASACGVQVRASVAPVLVTSGMTVSMRNHLVFSCPQRRRPFHLALVAWRPTGVEEAGWVPAAMTQLVGDLRLESRGWVAAGAGAYADGALDLCPPQYGAEAARACIEQLARPMALGAGSRGLGAAVYQAWKGLAWARADARAHALEAPLHQSMVVVVPPSLPAAAPGCATARHAFELVLADGIDVRLVCAAAGCTTACLDGIVAPDRRVERVDWPGLGSQMAARARASELAVDKVALYENLAPTVRFVPGSSDPAHRDFDATKGVLQWEDVAVPASQALEVSFAVWPRGRGAVPVTEQGYVLFTDTTGSIGKGDLPARRVTIGWPALLPLALRADLGIAP